MRWMWVWVGGSATLACAGLAVALSMTDLERLSWIAGAGSFVTAVPSLVLAVILARAQPRPEPARPEDAATSNRIGSSSGSAAVQAQTVHSPVQEAGRHGDTYHAGHIHITHALAEPAPEAGQRGTGWAGRAVRVAEASPRALGVHPARRSAEDGTDLPPYVPRDIDATLQRFLARAGERGGAVLVEGDSTAGKTRATLHALQQTLPGRLLYAPTPGDDLRDLAAHLAATRPAEGAVVWLDDLNRFLGLGEHGLTERLLNELLRCGVVVAATLRAEYADTYRDIPLRDDGSRTGTRSERETAAALLRRFTRVNLDRVWSLEEVARAAAAGDERLSEAAARHGLHGIAEYLAAGPELVKAWREARRSTARGGHPRGHAVVAAAVDLARTGLLTAPTRAARTDP
ncbi:hypothetical protein [Marinactinospora rubrisoli]|uniref:AAA+ ATPase domain-containing protein n=1 Tax=Marinactinospora rubrisoli TaxID=2715399 RepID=A0ABW2KGR6_9ACTN